MVCLVARLTHIHAGLGHFTAVLQLVPVLLWFPAWDSVLLWMFLYVSLQGTPVCSSLSCTPSVSHVSGLGAPGPRMLSTCQGKSRVKYQRGLNVWHLVSFYFLNLLFNYSRHSIILVSSVQHSGWPFLCLTRWSPWAWYPPGTTHSYYSISDCVPSAVLTSPWLL